MILSRKRNYENFILPYIFVFFASLNFYKMGSILWLAYTVLSILVYMFFRKGAALGGGYVLLFCILFSTFATLAAAIYFGTSEVIKAVLIFTSCLAGYCNYRRATNKEAYIARIIMTIFAAYLTQTVFLYIHNRNFSIAGQRLLYSLWENEFISVTVASLLCTVVIGGATYLFIAQKSIVGRMVAIFSMVFVFLLNMKTSTRTPFVLLLVVLAVAFLYFLLQSRSMYKVRIFIIVLVAVALLLLAWSADFLGMRTLIEDSSIYKRFMEEGIETARTDITKNHARAMFKYPFGGGKLSDIYGYAHNCLQEAHDLYGIFATLSFLVLIISFFVTYIKLIRSKVHNKTIHLFFFMYSAWIPQLFLEPIFESYPLFLWNFVFIHIMATVYMKKIAAKPIEPRGDKA